MGATVTAVGWVPAATEGNTARATPAASETGSTPDTRVVFLVASTGKPMPAAGDAALWPVVVVLTISRVVAPPQPATVRHAAIDAVDRIHAVHRIGPHVSDPERRSPHSDVRGV